MRILSITAQKPHSTGSGVYLTELVQAFSRLGHDQAVIAGLCREDGAHFPEGVTFYPVYFETASLPFPVTGMSDEMPYKSTRYRDLSPSMAGMFRRTFSLEIQKADREFQPELIICHHLYLLTALVRELLPHRKVAAVCHGSDLRQFQKNPLFREEIREHIRQLDAVYALHEEQKACIEALFSLKPGKVKVLGAGYNSQVFFRRHETGAPQPDASTQTGLSQPDPMPEAAASLPSPSPKKAIRLLFAGKLSEAKGVKSLIRAVGLLPDRGVPITLTLAGGHGEEGEYREILKLASSCPWPVSFPGKLTQKELAEEMNHSDLFVLPSFYEGLPLVLLEAMACGLRFVCTDLPGIRLWMDAHVPSHGGLFVPLPEMLSADEPVPSSLPLFESRLAEAVRTAVYNEDTRERREMIEKSLLSLSWDGVGKKLLSFLP